MLLGLTEFPPCPRHVGGTFFCDNNNLKTLKGAPEHVGRSFFCNYNKLTSLEGAPEHVGGNFNCYDDTTGSRSIVPSVEWKVLLMKSSDAEL
jgi:hypothetical protein